VVCEKERAGFNGGEKCLFHDEIYTQVVVRGRHLETSLDY